MHETPLVSIVVPSFNQAEFLPKTLDSIFSQSYRPLEVVVVDGGSQDDSVDILRTYSLNRSELRWISEKDKGPADAVNKGLAMVRGAIIGIQNSDDFYYSDAIEKAVKTFAKFPNCGMVYGDVEGVDANGCQKFIRRYPNFSWEAMFAICWTIGHGSIFFTRSLYQQLGGWNPAYYSCDLEYWMRLSFYCKPQHIPARLSAWRVYSGQRTSQEHFRHIWDGYRRMISDSTELRGGSARLRRLARASTHLLALRYHPRGYRWDIIRHGWAGFMLHPGFWKYNPWRRTIRIIPGWELARRVYHELKAACSHLRKHGLGLPS